MKFYIARDFSNDLYLYDEEPFFDTENGTWYNEEGNSWMIDDRLFPEITVENSPQVIEIELKSAKR